MLKDKKERNLYEEIAKGCSAAAFGSAFGFGGGL